MSDTHLPGATSTAWATTHSGNENDNPCWASGEGLAFHALEPCSYPSQGLLHYATQHPFRMGRDLVPRHAISLGGTGGCSYMTGFLDHGWPVLAAYRSGVPGSQPLSGSHSPCSLPWGHLFGRNPFPHDCPHGQRGSPVAYESYGWERELGQVRTREARRARVATSTRNGEIPDSRLALPSSGAGKPTPHFMWSTPAADHGSRPGEAHVLGHHASLLGVGVEAGRCGGEGTWDSWHR